LIRKFFRFDRAPGTSLHRPVPTRGAGKDRPLLRFLAGLAALLFLTPSLAVTTCPVVTMCLVATTSRAASAATPASEDVTSPRPAANPFVAAPPPLIRTSDASAPTDTKVGAAQGAPKSEAAEAWDAIKDTTNPALLEAFIKRYGTTFFAEIAKARLDDLKTAAAKPSPPASAKAIPTYPIHRGPELPANSFQPPALQPPADGFHQRVVLYDEDPSDPMGLKSYGSAAWRTDSVKAEGKPEELSAHADVDIPSRGLRMTMSFRRNLDPALPASHVIELTFRTPADFDGGGVATVPGLLMKANEQARGAPLAGLSVKVTAGSFLIGLSNVAGDRERNLQQLAERRWFDIPIVYANQRRGILAIEKGEAGQLVFRTVLMSWGQYPDEAQPATASGDKGTTR
jgi:hypothetical protein